MKKISLIVPCYNEEQNIELFINAVDKLFKTIPYKLELITINDGSNDETLSKLLKMQETHSYIKVVDLSRNFGKESALSAGLFHVTGDAAIPIDADLQHPIELIPQMIELWLKGYEVVLAKRTSRKTDTAFQRVTAQIFYKLHNKISDIEIPADVGDFRLMDRSVVNALNELKENRRFMKGLFAWVGFKTTSILYEVSPRLHGTSKFKTWQLWNFALEGITSFSTAPLKIWTYAGVVIAGISLLYALYIIIKTLLFGSDLAGYPSILVSILFMGGIQLISIGTLGEYIGRIYMESKNRPPYIIRKTYTKEKTN
ncbi:bactoprenol glucosyl transferase [Sulfurimonas hongkongensis]|uniref:Bactoprenol glucosyl transferase n=1 Tax=Sulfurimonas hongkongensis TaxID=1172190 RepID=T0JBX5_9BACT|nr:glycosyltransferase family 2 protein [Sulfurimonas hongkongensis]EQB34337.1 bactoprenol glucosyl transferase [Sulfurimonas hongkongensis]